MAGDPSTVYLGVLIGLAVAVSFVVGYVIAALRKQRELTVAVADAREDTRKRQRSTVGGQVAETLRPFIGDFPYDPSDLTFIGDPVDFIAFKGRAASQIEEVVFLEVKQGGGSLSTSQRQVRDAIQSGRVRWVETKFPELPES